MQREMRDDDEEMEEQKCDSKDIMSKSVFSEAIVKYEEPELQLLKSSYVQLDEKTDLNDAPSNWLKEHIFGRFMEQMCQNVPKSRNQTLDFSSLLMAGRYPEMLTEVDVVSSSKQIKKLLKTPFNINSSYSMMVHRIGKTLLLNDLDIPSFLKSNQDDDKFQWLCELYCTANNMSKDSQVFPKKRNKELSQLQLMESKFMHYSVDFSRNRRKSICDSNEIPTLPTEPEIPLNQNLNDCFSPDSYFLRDVLWKFEDITMLVGSDLPIFGNGKYPAVSLRLRDSSKPINVLTGIDYWLDNLMCNVPELLMCYHLKGIVQKYERIKTDELPKECQFSQNVIKDIAQNMLSFLKANCTKEGHTYWLFKSSKDDVVKLYDLTSISAQNSKNTDPFSSSVSSLLFKIAYNMYSMNPKQWNIPKMVTLLHNCILLQKNDERPELTLMASYLLSNLYSNSIAEMPGSEDSSEDISDSEGSVTTDEESSENETTEPLSKVEVKDLCASNPVKKKINQTIQSVNENLNEEQKCQRGLSSIIRALEILYAKSSTDCISKNNDKLILSKSIQESKDSILLLPYTSHGKNVDNHFSSSEMSYLLFENAAKCYVTLVKISIAKEKLGRALRFLQISFHCLSSIKKETIGKTDLSVKALMFFGDILTIMASRSINIDREKEELSQANANDEKINSFFDLNTSEILCFEVNVSCISSCFEWKFDQLLKHALSVYEESLNNVEKESQDDINQVIVELTRRLGNVKNELGVFYLNSATNYASQCGVPSENEMLYWKKSFMYFEEGVKAFEFINDRSNMALLYSNTAKLMRLCAQVLGNSTKASVEESRGQFTVQEETYFKKAFEYYNKAISLVKSSSSPSNIADNLYMELSGAYFQMATLMQEHAPLTSTAEEKAIKEISTGLLKSLQCAENVSVDNFQLKKSVQSQIGLIHQKLASLYHHVFRNQLSDNGKKNYRSLVELHYAKVYTTLPPDSYPVRNLKVIMEHLAFLDFLLQQGYSTKSLKTKLELLFNNKHLKTVMTSLHKKSKVTSLDKTEIASLDGKLVKKESEMMSSKQQQKYNSSYNEEIDGIPCEELEKLLGWFHSQLSTTLKDTIKYLNQKKYANFCKLDIKTSKQMFEVVIRGSILKLESLPEKLTKIVFVIELLQKIYIEL